MATVAGLIAARASGLYRLEHLPPAEEIAPIAAENDFRLFRIDGRRVTDKAGFLRAVARTLEFPDYFGENWDALEECLTDLEWVRASGFVVYLEHLDEFAESSPDDFDAALEIFATAADYWDDFGRPMLCFVELHHREG